MDQSLVDQPLVDQPLPCFHEAAFEADPGSARMVRDFVASLSAEHLPAYLVGDLTLVADELATNALAHAGTAFTVSIERVDATILLTVTDGSPRVPEQRPPSEDLQPNGRGLAIVAVLSRRWGVASGPPGAKSVWAAFDAHQGDVGARS